MQTINSLLTGQPYASFFVFCSIDGYLWKGRALMLLEQVEAAVEVFQTGINFDLQNVELLSELKIAKSRCDEPGCLSEAARIARENRASKRRRAAAGGSTESTAADGAAAEDEEGPPDDYNCPLCCKLLYEPVTTPCGHTFCRGCLMRVLDHGNRCPMCRVVLHMSARRHPISVNLQSILTRTFPQQTEARRKEALEEVDHGPSVLPLFVVDFVLPGQVLALNIFEPRYRLMVRRCLDGDRRFGMLGSEDERLGGMALGCEMEIQDSRQLHDGRYHIQVKAIRRFSIMQKWDLDGYRVARVTFFDDSARRVPTHPAQAQVPAAALPLAAAATSGGDGSGGGGGESMAVDDAVAGVGGSTPVAEVDAEAAAQNLLLMVRQVQIMVKEWLVRARTLSTHSPKMSLLFRQLVARAGKPPKDPSKEIELYSFWVGNILPTSTRQRWTMLGMVRTKDRLMELLKLLHETVTQCNTSADGVDGTGGPSPADSTAEQVADSAGAPVDTDMVPSAEAGGA